jgi:hypothetical protein
VIDQANFPRFFSMFQKIDSADISISSGVNDDVLASHERNNFDVKGTFAIADFLKDLTETESYDIA